MKNYLKKICIVAVALLAVLFAGYQLFFNPYRGTAKGDVVSMPLESELTEKQVLEDLDYTVEKLRERHPAWLEDSNEQVDAVEAAYNAERQQLLSDNKDGYSVLEEWRIISGMLHQLYDGHTRAFYVPETDYYIDNWTQLNELGIPAEINGISTEDLQKEYLELFSYEREEYAKASFDVFVKKESYLKLCGVDTSDGVTYTYDTKEGPKDYYYTFVPRDQVMGQGAQEDEWVSYDIDEDSSTATFTLKECNYNKVYQATLEGFFDAVYEKNIENVVVDLRGNGGGNSYVADAFLQYLDIDGYDTWSCDVRYGNFLVHGKAKYCEIKKKEHPFSGNLYVLTDVYTYSAAMDFAMLVSDNHLGTILGEASGNLPDSYGDILEFSTPNSKLIFSVSYKKWYRIDQSKAGQPIEPDGPWDDSGGRS